MSQIANRGFGQATEADIAGAGGGVVCATDQPGGD